MSEGEMLGKQLDSKKKKFEPNLGTKRRERLSSFSAYSSCDEEDLNPKKKKKKKDTKKTTEENEHLDEKKSTKAKAATKPKKNRENVEPNKERAPRKKRECHGIGARKKTVLEDDRDMKTA